jgi:UDP-2-acetamido-3-amino-2,3-dideoxy-glucuronate N-acetyltransferase
MPDFFVHESSYIDAGAIIGVKTKIWHFCHVMGGARIGRGCNIGQNVFIGADAVIGDNVKIQNNVSIYTGVVIEDDVFLGPSMVFTNVVNPRSHIQRRNEYQTTLVKRGATIGANATVVCGTTIGNYAFVGAGSVVTHDIPNYALAHGNPARVRGWMCWCGVRLDFSGEGEPEKVTCHQCGKQYFKRGQDVRAGMGEE